jgi:hypothetical protein
MILISSKFSFQLLVWLLSPHLHFDSWVTICNIVYTRRQQLAEQEAEQVALQAALVILQEAQQAALQPSLLQAQQAAPQAIMTITFLFSASSADFQ